jgi:hypothetical protein
MPWHDPTVLHRMIVGPRHGVALQGTKHQDKKRPDQPIQPKFSKFRIDL